MIGAYIEWTPGRRNSPGYVVAENGCHLWLGSRTSGGYAHVTIGGKQYMVHRIRYEREVGPVPDGLELDHLCDNGPGGCCNPLHLKPVTHQHNIARAKAKVTHCPKGHLLAGDNLEPARLRRGWRVCKACCNARQRARYHGLDEGQREALRERARRNAGSRRTRATEK